ncbi:MAG: DNA polymerase III subunit chi [Zoogloeaceae bacterium]|jgi:DNA polymerase-3 subunit chi|nr:DNA polymerase III subunit chi [Zoogloeaceae bacterium]
MTKVFFYHDAGNRLQAACDLIVKSFAQGKTFTILVSDPEREQFVDRMLWVQPQLSFLPHCRADAANAAQTPVLLTKDTGLGLPHLHTERLLNLDDRVPESFARFQNLIEIVSQSEADRAHARQRSRIYKEQGCEIRFIDLQAPK